MTTKDERSGRSVYRIQFNDTTDMGAVEDTLLMARQRFPGQRNSLDALCKRYQVDNSGRSYHGALLDARLLADVYLSMTAGQGSLSLDMAGSARHAPIVERDAVWRVPRRSVSVEEAAVHELRIAAIERKSGSTSLWRQWVPSAESTNAVNKG